MTETTASFHMDAHSAEVFEQLQKESDLADAARKSFLSPNHDQDPVQHFIPWLAQELEVAARALQLSNTLDNPDAGCGHDRKGYGQAYCECPPSLGDLKVLRKSRRKLFGCQRKRTVGIMDGLRVAEEWSRGVQAERSGLQVQLQEALRRATQAERDGERHHADSRDFEIGMQEALRRATQAEKDGERQQAESRDLEIHIEEAMRRATQAEKDGMRQRAESRDLEIRLGEALQRANKAEQDCARQQAESRDSGICLEEALRRAARAEQDRERQQAESRDSEIRLEEALRRAARAEQGSEKQQANGRDLETRLEEALHRVARAEQDSERQQAETRDCKTRLEEALRRAARAEQDGKSQTNAAEGQLRRLQQKFERQRSAYLVLTKTHHNLQARREIEVSGRSKRRKRCLTLEAKENVKLHAELRKQRAAHQIVSTRLSERTVDCTTLTEVQRTTEDRLWEMGMCLEAERFEHELLKTSHNDERSKYFALRIRSERVQSELAISLQAAQDLQKQLCDAQADCEAQRTDRRTLQNDLEGVNRKLRASHEAEAQSHDRLETANATKETLEATLREAEGALSALQVAKSESEGRLESCAAENQQIASTLQEEQANKNGFVHDLQNERERVKQLERDVQQLESRFDDVSDQLSTNNDATSLLEMFRRAEHEQAVEDLQQRLKIELGAAAKESATLHRQLDICQKRDSFLIDGLRRNLDYTTNSLADARLLKLGLEHELKQIRQELSDVRLLKQGLEYELKQTRQELSDAQESLSSKRNVEEAYALQRQVFEEQLRATRSELRVCKQATIDAKDCREQVERELTECRFYTGRLEKDLENARVQEEDYRKESERLLEANGRLQSESDVLLEKARLQEEHYRKEGERLLKANGTLQSGNDSLLVNARHQEEHYRKVCNRLLEANSRVQSGNDSLKETLRLRDIDLRCQAVEASRLQHQVFEQQHQLDAVKTLCSRGILAPTRAFHVTAHNADFFYRANPVAAQRAGNVLGAQDAIAASEARGPAGMQALHAGGQQGAMQRGLIDTGSMGPPAPQQILRSQAEATTSSPVVKKEAPVSQRSSAQERYPFQPLLA